MNSHRYSFYLAPSSRPKAVRFRDRSGFPPVRLPAAHSQRAPAYARAVAARWCGVCRAVRCALDCAPSRIRACASACNMPAMHPQPAGRTHLRGFALALTALLLSVRPALGRCARGSTRALRARPQSRLCARRPLTCTRPPSLSRTPQASRRRRHATLPSRRSAPATRRFRRRRAAVRCKRVRYELPWPHHRCGRSPDAQTAWNVAYCHCPGMQSYYSVRWHAGCLLL